MDNRRKVRFDASIKKLLDTRDPNFRAQVLSEGPIFDLVKGDSIEEFLTKPIVKVNFSSILFVLDYFLKLPNAPRQRTNEDPSKKTTSPI